MAHVSYKRLPFQLLKIIEAIGVKGDHVDYHFEENFSRDEIVHRVLYVEGEARCERITGEEDNCDCPLNYRKAGDSTFDTTEHNHLNSGHLRFTATSDSFKFYCISHPEQRLLRGATLNKKKDEEFTIDVGNYLFIGNGAVSTVIGDDIQVFHAPMLLPVVNKEATFTVIEDAIMARIVIPA